MSLSAARVPSTSVLSKFRKAGGSGVGVKFVPGPPSCSLLYFL